MAFIRAKGTVLQQMAPSTIYVTIAQLLSITLPDMEAGNFACDTLDNAVAAIPYKGTGSTEGGSVGFEAFLDPVLEAHTEFLALLTTALAIGSEEAFKIIFADAGTTEWPFTAAGVSFGGTVALGDGVKFTGSIKIDGIITFP